MNKERLLLVLYNLASLLSSPKDIDSKCVQLDNCLQQPHILPCKFLRHKRVIDSGEEVCPLMLLLRHRGNMEKEVRALVESPTLDYMKFFESGYDLEVGEASTPPNCGSSGALNGVLSMMLSSSNAISPWLPC